MKPCLSEATTLPRTFAEDVAAFTEAGCPAIEVWLTKLEQHLERHTPTETRQLLDERGAKLVAASYQGGLLLSQGEQRKAHYDHFRRRLDLCQQFGIGTLLVVGDFGIRPDETSLQRAVVSLAQAAQWAAGFDVRLALEFRGGDAFCASLDTALTLVRACGEPNVGVNFDLFHYYQGPSKFEDFDHLRAGELAFVQVCDVAGIPRELMSDSDRVLPGDGDFQIEPILNRLRQIGYDGFVSLELLNPTIWQMNPAQVAELGFAALRRVLPS